MHSLRTLKEKDRRACSHSATRSILPLYSFSVSVFSSHPIPPLPLCVKKKKKKNYKVVVSLSCCCRQIALHEKRHMTHCEFNPFTFEPRQSSWVSLGSIITEQWFSKFFCIPASWIYPTPFGSHPKITSHCILTCSLLPNDCSNSTREGLTVHFIISSSRKQE